MAHHQIHDQSEFARDSFRRSTQNIFHYDEKSWRWSYLKQQFKIHVELGSVYERYTQKLQHGYFAMFLILQFLLGTSHFVIVLSTNMVTHSLDAVILDLFFYALLAVTSILGIYISERQIKQNSRYLTYLSIIAFCLLFATNIIVPLYHYWKNDWYFRPAFTTYIVIACYVFLNISKIWMAMGLGMFTSLVHGVFLIFVTYPDIATTWEGTVCEVLYLGCLNIMGVYYRMMNEFVKRKSFLDRRDYVRSNIELQYCKNDEETLMLSIIPANVIDDVRKDIMNYFKSLHLNQRIEKNQYIRFHENVTILYADIVNYTAMTTKLTPPTRLVETLNDLFSTFDEASEKLRVLRIKFLGDCYYCVSGLPPDNVQDHTDACVELGLEMIKIIRIESVKHNIDIDMRIGIHTGNIYSGVIGMSKWQYDVWSQDVSIANKMETTGVAGKVHITQQTRNQLKKTYNISETDRGSTCDVLKPYNLTTYLVTPEEVPIRTSLYEKHPHQTLYGNRRSTGALYRSKSQEKLSSPIEERCRLTFMEDHILGNSTRQDEGSTLETIPSLPPSPVTLNFPPLARSSIISLGTQSGRSRRDSRSHSWTMGTERTIHRRKSSAGSTAAAQDGRREGQGLRRTAFFDNTINRFNEVLLRTDTEIMDTIDKMPLSKYDQWRKVKHINSFMMIFKDLKNEWIYFQMPDPLFKYYLVAEILVLLALLVIENLTLAKRWNFNWPDILAISSIASIAFIVTPISWTSYIWNSWEKTEREECEVNYLNTPTFYEEPTEHPKIVKPASKIPRLLYEASEIIARNVFIRIGIYLFICGLFFTYLLVELVNCDISTTSEETDKSMYSIFLRIFLRTEDGRVTCSVPWHLTESCFLLIILTFIFLRIHLWIKFVAAATISGAYSIILWNFSGDYFRDSGTFNHNLNPAISHIISVIFLTLTLHFVDRQQDYLNRLDHQWTQKLIQEKDKAQLWKRINRSLLHTILPEHVAGIFLSNREPRTLYCESYPNVSVLFATIVNYDIDEITEKLFLKVMDEMIGAFDFALDQNFRGKIEKIKMSNWTYMAACGLAPGNRDSQMSAAAGVVSSGYVVKTLLQFAVHLMQIVPRHMNADAQQDFKIRIGMSHGDVTAGVVGAKKPLYDIWGDTVNMASRMDSTGVPGCIQVTAETAETLQKLGISCTYRGHIYVKGKSRSPGIADVPTYFVDLKTQKWNHHDIPVLPGQGIYSYNIERNGTSNHLANGFMNGSRESIL